MGRLLKLVIVIGAGLLFSGCADDWGIDQHGKKVTAAQLDGQWLIINYWAQWCAPCRTEIPELNRLQQKLSNQPAAVLGVNFDALQGQELLDAVEGFAIEYLVLAQDPAMRLQLPRAAVLPVTYIVDPQGQVRERLLGEQHADGLLARLMYWKDLER